MLFLENINIGSLYIRSARLMTVRHYYSAAVAMIVGLVGSQPHNRIFRRHSKATQCCGALSLVELSHCSVVVRGACVVNLQAALGLCLSIGVSAASVGPKLPSLHDQ